MALFPKVQEKCFSEINEVIGTKPPSIEDMPKLTYIMATCMEIQRYSLVAQATLSHRLTQDTEYGQYKFKKGTMFFANLDKFLNDPSEFPEPKKFIPERFMENGILQKKDHFVPFGVGKRICMGESLAKNELFVFFVRILQRLQFKVIEGQEPSPKNYVSGVTRIPDPFNVKIIPRN